jgi:hypothetical protein
MDDSGRPHRADCGGVVAFSGSSPTGGNTTRRERSDHLRAISRFPAARSGATARLAQQLAAPGLSPAEKTSLESRKAYCDQLAAMPEAERDALYRERFDQIDTNHDGALDAQERAAWREKQRENYRQQAAERARPAGGQH